jgi:hypothetical protein
MLADRIADLGSAQDMVDGLIDLTAMEGPLPDDVTVLVVRCSE